MSKSPQSFFKDGITKTDDALDISMAKAYEKLLSLFENATEFSKYELKALSLLQTDKYLSNLIEYFIENKKHIKRKYIKEILKAFGLMSSNIKESNFFKKMLQLRGV